MQRLPKMSIPLWLLLGGWTLLCGFLTLNSVGRLRAWEARANGFQRTNAHLVHELTLSQQQLRAQRIGFAATRTRLAATQSKLLDAQSELQERQHPGENALFRAIRNNDAHAVETLLKEGADPNGCEYAEDCEWTALVTAVIMGYSESPDYAGPAPRDNLAVVRALLAHGADVNRTCSDGVTSPWSLARRHGSDALVSLLERAGAK